MILEKSPKRADKEVFITTSSVVLITAELIIIYVLRVYVNLGFEQTELTSYNNRKTCTHLKCLPMSDAFCECVDKTVNIQTTKSCFD